MNHTLRPDVIDTHVHLWDPRRLHYPWLAGFPALNRAHLAADYAQATSPIPSGKFIVVEGDCASFQQLDEVDWLAEVAITEPRLKGIVAQASLEKGLSVRPHLAQLARNPLVKGVRRILQGEADPSFFLRGDFVEGVRLLEEFGFVFDLCVKPLQLPAIVQLVRLCPSVQFILDHCGKPAIRHGKLEGWRLHLRALSVEPNVACKISGLMTEAAPGRSSSVDLKPCLDHVTACFGPDRILFGSDWPVCELAGNYAMWTSILGAAFAGATASDLDKVYRNNAERFYHV